MLGWVQGKEKPCVSIYARTCIDVYVYMDGWIGRYRL